MIKETLLGFDMLYLPLIALFIFLTLFGSMLIWVLRKDNDPLYRHMSKLPYEGEQHE